MKVFQKVLKKYEYEQNKPSHQVIQYPYTISSQKNYILSRVRGAKIKRLSFAELIEEKPEKILVIFNFLAILELLQLKIVTLHLGEGFNNFWIEELSGEAVPE